MRSHRSLSSICGALFVTFFASAAFALPPDCVNDDCVLPTALEGVWELNQITCNGTDSATITQASIQTGTNFSLVSFPASSRDMDRVVPTTTGMRTWLLGGTCSMSVGMTSVSATVVSGSTSGTLSFTDGSASCNPSSCATGCAGTGSALTFPYTLSGTSLTVDVTDYSPFANPCNGQSAPIVFHYTKRTVPVLR